MILRYRQNRYLEMILFADDFFVIPNKKTAL